MEAAYVSVYLWKAMVEKAGSFDVEKVKSASDGITFDAPEGKVTVDGATQHISKTARIGKVGPCRVCRLNECVFLRASPAFDFFFAGDRFVDVLELFDVDKRVKSIPAGEGAPSSIAMIGDSSLKVVGHADVHHIPFGVRENVNEVSVHPSYLSSVSMM